MADEACKGIKLHVEQLSKLGYDYRSILCGLMLDHNEREESRSPKRNVDVYDVLSGRDEEKEQSTHRLSLLAGSVTDEARYNADRFVGLCSKGHPCRKTVSKATVTCRVCSNKVPATVSYGVCARLCGAQCVRCGIANDKRIRRKLEANEVVREFVVSELMRRPEIQLDLLCRLKNRSALDCLLEDIVVAGGDLACHYVLLLFDLDDFKRMNSMLGHDGADAVLKMIGYTMQSLEKTPQKEWLACRKTKQFKERGFLSSKNAAYEKVWCFRNGGDEFAIVAKETDSHSLSSLLVDRLRSDLKNGYERLKKGLSKPPEKLGISIGIAKYINHSGFKNKEEWFGTADKKALYGAKGIDKKNTDRIWNRERGKIETFQDVQNETMYWHG